MEISYSKMGIHDFNFGYAVQSLKFSHRPSSSYPFHLLVCLLAACLLVLRYYNRTKFGGLENLQPNSYINSCLQAFYFIPQLRVFSCPPASPRSLTKRWLLLQAQMLNHLCNQEFCFCCELGFLFHMLDISNGASCNASNFIRAFIHNPQSAALLEPAEPDAERVVYGKLGQMFHLLMVNQIQRESARSAESQGTHTTTTLPMHHPENHPFSALSSGGHFSGRATAQERWHAKHHWPSSKTQAPHVRITPHYISPQLDDMTTLLIPSSLSILYRTRD